MSGVPLRPWWQGFKGEVTAGADAHSYITKGISVFDDEKKTVTITELPVGVWTKDYKMFLDEVASVEKTKDGEKVPKAMEHAYTDDGKPVLKVVALQNKKTWAEVFPEGAGKILCSKEELIKADESLWEKYTG
jgi:DNA topoisomerase-2